MAEPKVVTYATLDEAKAACAAENEAVKEKGEGKERSVFAITAQGEHKFYVVATLSGKARAIAALALDIKANVAEKKAPTPQKSLLEQVKGADSDKIAEIKALLAAMEAEQSKPAEVGALGEPIVEEAPKPKKGKKYD